MSESNWNWSLIVDVAQALTSMSVAVVAWLGISAWKREHRGRRLAELAEDALTFFYEAERALHAIRSPFGNTSEGKSRQRGDNESEEVSKILDDAYVVIERYNRHKELFSKIRALRYRFMAMFGREASTPFEDLRGIENDLFGAAEKYAIYGRKLLEIRDTPKLSNAAPKYYAGMEEARAVFWEAWIDDDPIGPKLTSLIGRIEETCRSAIGARG